MKSDSSLELIAPVLGRFNLDAVAAAQHALRYPQDRCPADRAITSPAACCREATRRCSRRCRTGRHVRREDTAASHAHGQPGRTAQASPATAGPHGPRRAKALAADAGKSGLQSCRRDPWHRSVHRHGRRRQQGHADRAQGCPGVCCLDRPGLSLELRGRTGTEVGHQQARRRLRTEGVHSIAYAVLVCSKEHALSLCNFHVGCLVD